MRYIELSGAFAVTHDYRLLMEFSAGQHGWWVPQEVRDSAGKLLQELTMLRTFRDNPVQPTGPTTAPSFN